MQLVVDLLQREEKENLQKERAKHLLQEKKRLKQQQKQQIRTMILRNYRMILCYHQLIKKLEWNHLRMKLHQLMMNQYSLKIEIF